MKDVSVIILTKDEEVHLERCIRSVLPIAREVFVVDSFSNDRTREIAESLGAVFTQHAFVNQARQFNWALDHCSVAAGWILRLDADEYLTPELAEEIAQRLPQLGPEVTGVAFRRRAHFMGRWIRHGDYYPVVLLRLWRTGRARCEERWMDEHIQLAEGRSVRFEHDFVDDNLHSLSRWTEKHNGYATREAIEILNHKHGLFSSGEAALGGQAGAKRWLKKNLYWRLPPGLRALLYFAYRYFLRLGFLDGYPGFVFHTLQGFWYRFLIDAKVHELERAARRRGGDLRRAVKELYGIEL